MRSPSRCASSCRNTRSSTGASPANPWGNPGPRHHHATTRAARAVERSQEGQAAHAYDAAIRFRTVSRRTRMVSRVIEAYFHLLKGLIALCLAIMVVLVFGNVVL